MKVSIRDYDALQAVAPEALVVYALSEGWRKAERYGSHSDVYTAEDLPEIILPRTPRLGDYASVVARLIEIFAEVDERDETAVYSDLVNVDRDAVRVRVDGIYDLGLTVNDGVELIGGLRDMILATACSLRHASGSEAMDVLSRVRLEPTERDGFVATLAIPATDQTNRGEVREPDNRDIPIERRMTTHLMESVAAAKFAAECMDARNVAALATAAKKGASADLCEALGRMVSPFQRLDVGMTWARTRPTKPSERIVAFARSDGSALHEAARLLRTDRRAGTWEP